MHINLLKHAKLGSLVVAGALAASMAHAATFNIGGYEVNMDTTISVGSTWLVSDRNNSYLPEANGGNPNQNPTFNITHPTVHLRQWLAAPRLNDLQYLLPGNYGIGQQRGLIMTGQSTLMMAG